MSVPSYPTQQVLELACAAQRVNGTYLKTDSVIFSNEEDGKFVPMFTKHPNRTLMTVTLDPKTWTGDPALQPYPLKITQEDKDIAESIQKHYRKLAFAAVAGTNEFETSIHSILNSDSIPLNHFGYLACLPSLHTRDVMQTNVKRAARDADEGWLGEIGEWLEDLDCEILLVQRSKNFDAWNIDAKINNKLVSWMSKVALKTGPCVVVKAKVKDLTTHWKHETPVTRLNYVRAAQ